MFILAYHSTVLYINCHINIYLAGVELTDYLGGYDLYIFWYIYKSIYLYMPSVLFHINICSINTIPNVA